MSRTEDRMGPDGAGGSGHWFGHAELPPPQADALRRAKRLEVITLIYMVTCVAVVFATAGSSQAMKTAWVEDSLALVPPAGLPRRRTPRSPAAHRRPSLRLPPRHGDRPPDRGHRAARGRACCWPSTPRWASLRAEHPPIGTVRLLGHTFWAGWLMVAAMVYTGIGPFILGRMKLPLAEQLHDKVLYADADMQKADWMTAAGTIAGVLGIGLGLWWADAGAALLISLSIVRDGWTNLHYATTALMDERARTYYYEHPHPLLTRRVDEALAHLPWVDDSRSRVRDRRPPPPRRAVARPASSAGPPPSTSSRRRPTCCASWTGRSTTSSWCLCATSPDDPGPEGGPGTKG